MTVDSAIFLKRIRRLSQALLISGAINIGVLTLLLYWVLRERPPTPYCELKPATYDQQQIPLADRRDCAEMVAQLSPLTYQELVNRLTHTQLIEDGYSERDLALACMIAFHRFDIQRALPRNSQPQQKRWLVWQPKGESTSISLVVYPNLSDEQFEAITQFAKTERWPMSPEGLFLLLQEQKGKNEWDDSLVETFVLTPEFWTVELLFNRTGQRLSKQDILKVLLEGNWPLLKQFADQQRQLQDSSDARRQKFLLDYLKEGSASAADSLIKTEWEFSAKKLDDQQVLTILQLMSQNTPEGEHFAKEMLMSPRGTPVRQKAAHWLYSQGGEKVPDQWDHQVAMEHFFPDKFKKETPTPEPKKEAVKPPKPATPPPPPGVKSLSPKTTKTEPIKPLAPPKSLPPPTKKPLKESLPPAVKKVDSTKKSLPKTSAPKYKEYTIQEGDSLWKIAHRFKVKIEELRALNNLSTDALKPGTTLKIPMK